VSWSVVSGRILGIAIVVLTILTAVAFFVQSRQTAEATRCQSALLQTIISRSTANEEERSALRELVRARFADASAEIVVQQRYREYEAAIVRADAARAAQGRLDSLKQGCNTN